MRTAAPGPDLQDRMERSNRRLNWRPIVITRIKGGICSFFYAIFVWVCLEESDKVNNEN